MFNGGTDLDVDCSLTSFILTAVSDPKKAMANIYQKIPLFRDWPLHEDGDIGLIPASVATFGKEHSANWGNETYIPKVEVPLAYGEVDHSFSTDISRAKKVDSWKNVRNLFRASPLLTSICT